MIIKNEIKLGNNHYAIHSKNEPGSSYYDRYCEYQIIGDYKFMISKTVCDDMDKNDIDIYVLKINGTDKMSGENGYMINYYVTDNSVRVIHRDINDGHTNQKTCILSGDDYFEAITYINDMFEQYSDDLNLSDKAMNFYEEVMSKVSLVRKYAV